MDAVQEPQQALVLAQDLDLDAVPPQRVLPVPPHRTGRDPAEADAEAIYLAAGICPAGDIRFIDDQYANFDTRKVEGYDVGIYYDFETPIGDFSTRFVGSFLEKFEQEPGGAAQP